MYLVIRKDTHEFFTGYHINPAYPGFHHTPTIARRYQSKLNAEGKIQDIRAGHPHKMSGARLEVVEEPIGHRVGRLFTYYLFEGFLIISRKMDANPDSDWGEIMNSGRSHDGKWHEAVVEDDGNGIAHIIPPEEIGALTEAPIIGFDVGNYRDGTVEIHDDSYLYWYPDYVTTDELQKLTTDGYVVFERVETEAKPQENEDS